MSAADPIKDPQACELLENLRSAGFTIHHDRQWRGNGVLRSDLADCNAVLALIDGEWARQLWHATEIDTALELKPRPRRVFLYPIEPIETWEGRPQGAAVTTLDRNPLTACKAVQECTLHTTELLHDPVAAPRILFLTVGLVFAYLPSLSYWPSVLFQRHYGDIDAVEVLTNTAPLMALLACVFAFWASTHRTARLLWRGTFTIAVLGWLPAMITAWVLSWDWGRLR